MSRLWHRVAGMISRLRLSSAAPAGKVQLVEVSERAAPVELVEPYGLTSVASAGAEVVVLASSADPSGEIAICVGDRRYRVRSLAEGSVCLYDQAGHRVLLSPSAITIVTAGDTVQFQASAGGPNVSTNSGLVHGAGVDPFTGLTYFALGSTTNQVKAEKT